MALMPQRSSPGLNKIRRELKNRRKAATAPKGGVAKRSSALPPPLPLGRSAPIASASTTVNLKLVDSTKGGFAKNCSGQPLATTRSAAPRKIDYIPMGEVIQRCTAPPRMKPIFLTAQSPKNPPPPSPVSSVDSSSKTDMPVLMARRPSAELREFRCELEQRSKLAGVIKGGIFKKSSSALPSQQCSTSAWIQNQKPAVPHEPAGAATKKMALPTSSCILQAPAKLATKEIAYVPLGELPKRSTAPPRRDPLISSAAPGSAATKSKMTTGGASFAAAAPISVHKGMTVKVRRLVGTLPRPGKRPQRLVIWLSAVVVSDAEDGYIDVIFSGYHPRDDRFPTVRVAMADVIAED